MKAAVSAASVASSAPAVTLAPANAALSATSAASSAPAITPTPEIVTVSGTSIAASVPTLAASAVNDAVSGASVAASVAPSSGADGGAAGSSNFAFGFGLDQQLGSRVSGDNPICSASQSCLARYSSVSR